MKNVLLTIGMIVKNEEKYLEQCLTAIKPILENVDCELIIADTGSTDRTVEIARKFTDNVFYFEWIKDFAAARNSTLEKAKGEWYMFLDADEIFKSCGEIIYFFNSGEYKKYNSASYIIRNYGPDNGANCGYVDFSGPRLTKIRKNTAFEGKIHEALNTYGAPYKCLNDIADHYGYAFSQGEESAEEKFKRNSELLLKSFEAEKDSKPMLYLQLAECFADHDREKAYEYLDEGIKICTERENIVLLPMYSGKAYFKFQDGKFEETLEICSDYFSISKKIRPSACGTDVELLGFRASAYYNLKRYAEAIPAYIEFFDVFKDFKAGKLNTYDVFLHTFNAASDRNFIPFVYEFVVCCINEGKYNTVSEYLKTLPIGKYSFNYEHISSLVKKEIEVMQHFGYADANRYANQLDDYGRKLLRHNLCNMLFRCADKAEVITALSSISLDDPAFTEAAEIYKAYFLAGKVDFKQISDFTEKYSLNDFPEMLYIAVDMKLDISSLLMRDNYDVKVCVKLNYACFKGFHELLESYPVDCIEDAEGIAAAAALYIYSMKNALVTLVYDGKLIRKSIDKMFEAYSRLGARYCALTGELDRERLPEDVRACAACADIAEYRRSKRYKECITSMRELVRSYPKIAAVIEDYQKIVIREYEDSQPKNELEKLAAAVKNNIRSYISMGNMQAALHTLNEYKKINPSDPEIAELMKLLE